MIKEVRKGKKVLSKIRQTKHFACSEMCSEELNIITLSTGTSNYMGRCPDEKF